MDVLSQKTERKSKEKPLSLKKPSQKPKNTENIEELSPNLNQKAIFEQNLSNISFESNDNNNINSTTATNKPFKPKISNNKQIISNNSGNSANIINVNKAVKNNGKNNINSRISNKSANLVKKTEGSQEINIMEFYKKERG